jgi:hypothetical protein
MKLTEQELSNGRLQAETLQNAIHLMQTKGYVLFEGLLSADFVSALYTAFMARLQAHIQQLPANRGANRYQMHLPFERPFNDPQIIISPFILPIVEALIGGDSICHYFASDTALPGSEYQATHWDVQPLFPETDQNALPPYSLVLNIPLVDVNEKNGPLEIWPDGTHLLHGHPAIAEVAPLMHSEEVLMPAGTLLLRDSRMWHRGTPNRSDAARPNIALIYSRPWLKLRYPPIDIPQDTFDSLSKQAQHLFRMEHIG